MITIVFTSWIALAQGSEPSNDPVEMSDTVSGHNVRSLDIEDRTLDSVNYDGEKDGQYPKRIYSSSRPSSSWWYANFR